MVLPRTTIKIILCAPGDRPATAPCECSRRPQVGASDFQNEDFRRFGDEQDSDCAPSRAGSGRSSSEPVEVVTVDYDTEGADPAELIAVPQGEHKAPANAFVSEWKFEGPEVNPERVDELFGVARSNEVNFESKSR